MKITITTIEIEPGDNCGCACRTQSPPEDAPYCATPKDTADTWQRILHNGKEVIRHVTFLPQ